MQKAKLAKLAKFLREYVKPHWFNLETWASDGFDKKTCGSVGCLLGWSPAAFPRSGLKLKEDICGDLIPTYINSKGEEFENFYAAKKFYGLTDDQTDYIFYPEYYPPRERTRMGAIRRIEKFVKTDGKCMPVTLEQYYE